jgi:hypothetical protein
MVLEEVCDAAWCRQIARKVLFPDARSKTFNAGMTLPTSSTTPSAPATSATFPDDPITPDPVFDRTQFEFLPGILDWFKKASSIENITEADVIEFRKTVSKTASACRCLVMFIITMYDT